MKLWNRFTEFVARAAVATKQEAGQTMVEYGLIIALIAIVVAAVLLTLGSDISSEFNKVINAL
ncbi:MAG TPA: Flp family type IVb pilin [Gaiellaceae bacterium]|jgi:pilus assembly protein Flp/PilA